MRYLCGNKIITGMIKSASNNEITAGMIKSASSNKDGWVHKSKCKSKSK